MADRETIISSFKEFLVEELFVDLSFEEITTDMRLRDTLGVDSVGFTEIMAFIEDKYGVPVSKDEFMPENFRTVGALVEFTKLKINSKAA